MGCVACQPILDTKKNVFSYELLYRSSLDSTKYDAEDGVMATRELLSTAFGDIGIKKITGGKRAFVNFPAALLSDDIPMLYSKNILVVEVLENVKATEANIQALRKLKKQGYLIALDDFTYPAGYDEFVRIADIIKVDFLQYKNYETMQHLVSRIRKMGDKVLLAEKVETEEDFEIAKRMGFSLFQGFFFSRPKLHSSAHMSPMELSRLQLLRCLWAPELDFKRVAAIIKRDVVLSHKLLRIVNSSYYGLSFFVSSILHALVILGTEGTRKWLSFAILQDRAGGDARELSRMALTRGLFMERLTIPLRRQKEKETFFLLGLFSVADALMKAPMDEVLSQTNLSARVMKPLLTGKGEMSDLLKIVIGYERADWDLVSAGIDQFGFNEIMISGYYLQSLADANDFL